MSETEQRLIPGMQVGDYYLQQLVYEGEATRTWLAHQVSVNREVIIDSLNRAVHKDDEVVANYLSDVRTKAKVDHPLIGSVFEAVREEGICFYAREKIPGVTLEGMVLNQDQLMPVEVVHLLKQVADANLYLESKKLASLPLSSNQLFISDSGMCRMVNMAVGGRREYAISTHDKVMLGVNFKKLLKGNEPGATRTRSLLGYMADTEREIPLTWEQVKELAEGVERQLSEPLSTAALKSSTMLIKKPGMSKQALSNLCIALGVIVIGGLITMFVTREKPPKKRELTGVVAVNVQEFRNKNRGVKLREFTIDAHEVTIAEYAKFLRSLTPEMVDSIQHENQPSYKESYIPEDWKEMHDAAKSGGEWNGIKMSLNCPVVGVDWWDAYAFAEFHSRRLPTQDEWRAALLTSGTDPLDLEPSSWGAVDQESKDITKNKIYGLAGNVAEWSLKLSKQETDPMATGKKPVICGGSYSDVSDATSRRWLNPSGDDKDARDLRRPYIGFRTVGQPEYIEE
ncbi:MAG: sulfatase activating formylglycine-generating enzyme [Cryomorphaceae bacterium]|jgi:formylglycine-generating enzyme required for sulfatase activity